MKKTIFLSLFVFCFSMAICQCSSIYGIVNQGSASSLASVDRYRGGFSIIDSMPSIKSFVFGTQTIQPDSNRYITFGMDSSYIRRVYSINLFTGNIVYQPVCDSSLSDFHYDVKRKKLFALMQTRIGPLTFRNWLVTVNPVNGNLAILDSITGMRGVIAETSTIGIDSGRFYIIGLDNVHPQWLYALDENTGYIKYKKPVSMVYECQYDTVSKMIYCINDTGSNNNYKWFFDKLNPETGLVTVLDTIPGIQSVLGGSTAFAQDSLKYFIVGNDGGWDFYTINAPAGNTIRKPWFGMPKSYSGTQYDPCHASYCSNTFNQPICIATLDTSTNKYKIIWGRTNSPPAGGSGHYNIYKDTGAGYILLHSQPLNALSDYVDTSNAWGPVSYQISTVDSCGESTLSPIHTTIYLTVTAVVNADNLSWTPYIGFTPTEYRIFRGPALNALVQIDSVTNNVLTYTDSFPPLGSYYAIEAISPHGVCIPTTHRPNNRLSASLSGSFSNGFNTATLGINNINTKVSKLNIYPNPSNGNFTLNYSLNGGGMVKTTIVNELGQMVYDNTEQKNAGSITEQLNLQNLATGIYTLRMQTDNSIMMRKLVIVGNR